jgi:dCTP deaminase
VDPGYHGKLLFAVFNAGPVSVHLKQGDPCFLIWYADLDAVSERIKSGTQLTAFPVERINAISGELHSFEGLSKKLKDVEKGLGDRVHALERESALYKIVATALLGLAVTYVGALIKDYASKHDAPPNLPSVRTSTATAMPAPSPPAPVQQGPSGSPSRPQ